MGEGDFDGYWDGFYLDECELGFEGDLVWMDLDLGFSIKVFS
jgi:hypothetical protein